MKPTFNNRGLNALINDVIQKCAYHGFQITFKPNTHRNVGADGGWICDKNREINIYTGDKSYMGWIEVLLHESCHLDQYLDQSKLWFDPLLLKYSIYDYKKCPVKNRFDLFVKTTQLEIDCDIRALNKIKRYQLNRVIPIREYINSANIYHASHYYFYKLKCFYDGVHSPFASSKIIKMFPSNRILSIEESWKERPILERYLKKYHATLKD